MFLGVFSKKICSVILFFVVLSCVYGFCGENDGYIGIDEIKTDMDAYCLTVYQGTEVEKFDLDIIYVGKNISAGSKPSRNAILVKGTDPRFVHSGPVHGCSGSPVYIDGRLA